MNINIKQTDHQYFMQSWFDKLAELASQLNEILKIDDFELFYDEQTDFHCLTFKYENQAFLVRCYKVMALVKDNETLITVRPNSHNYITRHLRQNHIAAG